MRSARATSFQSTYGALASKPDPADISMMARYDAEADQDFPREGNMAFVTTGLANDGKTDHCAVSYDPTLANGLALAMGLQSTCEQDFAMMKAWFGGID